MKFIQEESSDSHSIQRYDQGRIIINGRSYHQSLILTPTEIHSDWRPQTFAELEEQDLARLLQLQPELILLGTGATHLFPHPSLTAAIFQQHIGMEAMDTAAACRTYNILLAEGRRVAAALLMI